MISDTVHRAAALDVRRILDLYAPNEAAKLKVDRIYSDYYRSVTSDHLARAMTGMLYDGLAYGNWPWIER